MRFEIGSVPIIPWKRMWLLEKQAHRNNKELRVVAQQTNENDINNGVERVVKHRI